MKKIFMAIMCLMMLSGCNGAKTPPEPSAVPTAAPTEAPKKTAISPVSDYASAAENVLGETEFEIDGETAVVTLATSAERDSDGYILWDDSQLWTLTVEYKGETYPLYDAHIHGKLYFDVTTDDDEAIITLIESSTVGLGVTEFTYSDNAFYAQKVITPPDNGNNIYSSVPDYL